MAHYLRLDSWLFWIMVEKRKRQIVRNGAEDGRGHHLLLCQHISYPFLLEEGEVSALWTSLLGKLGEDAFLDAFSHLYERVGSSVGRPVRPPVDDTQVQFVENGLNLKKIAL